MKKSTIKVLFAISVVIILGLVTFLALKPLLKRRRRKVSTRSDIYIEPVSRPHIFRKPINYPTRGYPSAYEKIGIMYNEGGDRYPLFGRQKYPGSTQYEYYFMDDTRNHNKVELEYEKELFDGDTLTSNLLVGDYKVELYDKATLRYI